MVANLKMPESLMKDSNPKYCVISFVQLQPLPPEILEDRTRASYGPLGIMRHMPTALRRGSAIRPEGLLPQRPPGTRGRLYSPLRRGGPPGGRAGSGTIFFSGCNLSCVFCQNYDISQQDEGREVSAEALARMMLALRSAGCHNINFVTPTHVVPADPGGSGFGQRGRPGICRWFTTAADTSPLRPLACWMGYSTSICPMPSTGGWPALKYSNAPGYVDRMKAAIKEMHRQVGIWPWMRMALLYAVFSSATSSFRKAQPVRLRWSASCPRRYPRTPILNVMAQYHPDYQACCFPELSRPITVREYAQALVLAKEAGLVRGLAML